MKADLTAKIFHDEDAAREHFQALRWPHGPVCPHCGTVDNATRNDGPHDPSGSVQVQVQGMPQAVLGDHGDAVRALTYPAA